MNLYGYNQEISCQNYEPLQNYNYNDQFALLSAQIQPFDECPTLPSNLGTLPLFEPLDPSEVPDIPDTCFNYITDLLREEYCSDDHFHTQNNVTLQDYMSAQLSYNKSLDAAIHFGESESPFTATNHDYQPVNVLCQAPRHCLDDYINMFSNSNGSVTFPNYVANQNIVQNGFVGVNPGVVSNGFGSSFVGGLPLVESCSGVGTGLVPTPLNVILGGRPPLNLIPGGRAPLNVIRGDRPPVNLIPGGGPPVNLIPGGGPDHLGGANFGLIMDSNVHQGNIDLYSNSTLLQDFLVNNLGMMGNFEGQQQAGMVPLEWGMVSEGPPIRGIGENVGNNSRRRKHGEQDEGENGDMIGTSNKQNAVSNDVLEQIEQYGDVILCPEGRSKPGALCNNRTKTQGIEDSSKGSKKRGNNKGQVTDLRGLLTRCAQCVAQVNLAGAYEMLNQIRQHSSPYGDFLQRVAHYLANGLEARLEAKGLELTHLNEEVSPSEILKANRIYVASVPYQIMSYYTMNKTIASLVEEAPSIHIIDFGIYYGLQWPCIIQNLSKRPNGPPKIRITGIDFPQRGFRPSERVEETGRCLGRYCEKYNVPFEYHPIAKKWEDVQLDELRIERNEPLVVNCLYRAHQLFDESVEENSPRDAFLKLVREINPDMFLHAVVNSTSNVPFFLNRFKEAMFHYSALFDIFESTMSREDNERILLESKLFGPQALNIIACEGVERVVRPETYKQWQIRTQRAGFTQVGLDRDLLRRARAMVRRSFRAEFSYDEDGNWVVQGWKGRILYAISCWKPS